MQFSFTVHGSDLDEIIRNAHAIAKAFVGERRYDFRIKATPEVLVINDVPALWTADIDGRVM